MAKKQKADSVFGAFTLSSGRKLLFNTYALMLVTEHKGGDFAEAAHAVSGGIGNMTTIIAAAALNAGFDHFADIKEVCGWIDEIGGLNSVEFKVLTAFVAKCYGGNDDQGETKAE